MKPTDGRQEIEAAHFDRLAEEQGEIWWGSATPAGLLRLRRRAGLILEALSDIDDARVLELGCGTGALSRYLLETAPTLRLTGIDISRVSIEVVQTRLGSFEGAVFAVGDALRSGYAEGSFDAVVGNSVLHHLPLEACLAEAYRVLRPGGVLWFSEPNMLNPEVALEKKVRFIGKLTQTTPDETAFFRWSLAGRLCAAGFVEVSVRPYDFLHPLIPSSLVAMTQKLEWILERTPLLREISGSLMIGAVKP